VDREKGGGHHGWKLNQAHARGIDREPYVRTLRGENQKKLQKHGGNMTNEEGKKIRRAGQGENAFVKKKKKK